MRVWDKELERLSKQFNKPGIRVLDVGVAGDVQPGGHYHLFDKAEYKTLDISDALFADYVMDIRNTNFKDKEWDLVLVMCVLEHIPGTYYLGVEEAIRIGKTVVFGFPLILEKEFEADSHPPNPQTIMCRCKDYLYRVYDGKIAYLEVYK